jgi:hypothetical protein
MQFYIYEHWRPDKNECFYVGKGKRYKGKTTFGKSYRAYEMIFGRNRFHKVVVAKLTIRGFCVDVRIIFETNSEEEVYAKEIERIAYWRSAGIHLTNIADGGGRNSGWKDPPEILEQKRQRMLGKQFRLGAVLSEETKKKISVAHTGKTYSDEYKAAMVVACTGEKNGFFGKTHTPETRAKVAAANRGRVWSEESKAKLSATLKSLPHKKRTKTWTHTEETKVKMRIAAAKRWQDKKARDATRST